jgi:pimeloyl-ACP methyl ester carboxylesterase
MRPLPFPGLALLLAACADSSAADPPTPVDLRPCPELGVPDAVCGSLLVPEDPAAPGGRLISLAISVLPATGAEEERAPDPVFALHGGPGAAARHLAPLMAILPARENRDIVLVDQRGTGLSNGLACGADDPEQWLVAILRFELDPALCPAFDADPRLYTTPLAMDDLDRVREVLGYDRVNLWGGSYGTRAALVYARRHPERVRSMVLDGVAPLGMAVPSHFPRTAQAALDRVLEDCAADPDCSALGDLEAQLAQVLDRLEEEPFEVQVPFPGEAAPVDLTLGRNEYAGALLYALYTPPSAAVVPGAIATAYRGDYSLAAAMGAGFASALRAQFSLGMTLSVLCAEDVPYFTEAEMDAEARGTFLGEDFANGLHEACAAWPTGSIPEDHRRPLTADLPTLILSGEADPVTPPEFGDEVAATLSRSLHLVFQDQGHGVTALPCGARLVSAFLEAGSPEGLDTACVAEVGRPPFPG